MPTFITNYLKTHCAYFWHDWRDTKEPNGMVGKESWYWIVQRCRKCKGKRTILK